MAVPRADGKVWRHRVLIDGRRVSGFGITPALLDTLFRKYRKKTPIEDLHSHDTRHEATGRGYLH